MAFVRWRGNCAQLLATVTADGRPRHRLLANLHGAYRTTPALWAQVAEDFPEIPADWAAVDRALALGPPSAVPPTAQQVTWADTAHQLLAWAMLLIGDPRERRILADAAALLTSWQSRRQP